MISKSKNSLTIKNQRRKFTSEFKSKVVLEAISEREPLNVLAQKFDIDSNQILDWKKIFLTKAYLVFDLEKPQEEPPADKSF